MAAAAAATSGAVALDNKHKLARTWTYWEYRKHDRSQGMPQWSDTPTSLFSFETVEDFWAYWSVAPKITDTLDAGDRPAPLIQREDVDHSNGRTRTLVTKAEGYALFRDKLRPLTEEEIAPGVRATQNRRRAEIAVRPRDFDQWGKAWETTVLSLIGETVDPAEYIVGAALTNKKSKSTVALRLELWFGVKDDDICDAIAGELAAILHAETPDLPFRFKMPSYEAKRGDREKDRGTVASGTTATSAAASIATGGGYRSERSGGGYRAGGGGDRDRDRSGWVGGEGGGRGGGYRDRGDRDRGDRDGGYRGEGGGGYGGGGRDRDRRGGGGGGGGYGRM